ncbi:Uncharacterised protein [Mycobacteroides abscessus subsp. abscessus]|nr:Uncharacterised protein [Mycobacteroides abscessus subsp. abscessus]
MQPFEGNGALRELAGGACRQSEVSHGRFEAFESVFASRVQLKGFAYQRRAFGINMHGVDKSAFVLDADVAVADGGLSCCAAVDSLVLQFDLDVFTAELVLHVVENVGDGFHHVGVDAVTEILTGGNQLDVQLIQEPFGDGRIYVVTEGTGAGVYDDVFDLGMLSKVREHFLKSGSFLDGGGGDARLDELLDHRRVETVRLLGSDLALGGDRVAFRVNVYGGVHLLFA